MNKETEFHVDFFGVGGEKTASSWIFTCLKEHPEICGSSEKETCFFDTTLLLNMPPREKSDYEKYEIEKYAQYFAHCKQNAVCGEFTVTYLHDKRVARLLSELFPKAKILISLRNPTDRAYSQYLALAAELPYKNFEEAIAKEPEFIRRSMYAEYVGEYFKHFPREQVLVVLYEDIGKDKKAFLSKIFSFLGVDSSFIPSSIDIKERSAEGKRMTAIRDEIRKNVLGNFCYEIARALGLTALIKKILSRTVKKPEMKGETREHLQVYFSGDIAALEKLLEKDLSAWR